MRPVNESRIRANGVGLELYEWPADGPTVFLAHATGFHARCWDEVVERLPGVRCIAIDMRGHGRSEKPDPPYRWTEFGEDVAAVGRQIGLRGALGAGHSKGGYAVTLAAALAPELFSKLLLIDPVIMPPDLYRGRMETEHFAARRRNEWRSPEEMYERFAGRPPFSSWDPEVLRDYVEFGLLPNAQGEGYVLACPPNIEAAVYAGSSGDTIHEAIKEVRIPVRVLRARQRTADSPMDMSSSPTWPGLAASMPNAEDRYLPQYSHFMPMEDPGFVAGQILEMLG
ncbi:MAG: alpha/beta hydrolase [Dehalococcoidia bacterium]|nr:alpha/beta hydrolase [Dehalococcoidia bacterium]